MSDIGKHIVRSIDVVILGTIYLVLGLTVSFFVNKLSTKPDPSKGKLVLIWEIIVEVAVTVWLTYLIHRLIERAPLPLLGGRDITEGIIKEVRGGIVIAFAMFALQVNLRQKIQLVFFGSIENLNLVDY